MQPNQTLRVAVRQFEPFTQGVLGAWDRYCAQTGCTLSIEAVPMELHPLYDAILGTGGLKSGVWDLSMINTDWLAEAYAKEALLDLKPLIEKKPPEGFPEAWSDSMLGFQDFGDAVVGLPYHDGPECLIYRRDLFEDPAEKEAFLRKTCQELRPPETWEAFVAIARFFTRPEKNLYGTVFAAFPDGHNTVFDFALQVWTRGGELVDAADRVSLNTPAAIEGMTFYRQILQDQQSIHPDSAKLDSVQSGLAFARGEVAMMVNWFGFAAMSEVIQESVVKGKIDLADIPHAPDCLSASLNCYWMYAVGSGSHHADVAYDFARFMASADEDRRMTLGGGSGCRKSTWQDPKINAVVPHYHKLERLHENARTLPRLANWSQLAGVIDEAVTQVVETGRAVPEILETAQKQADAIQR